MLLAWAEDGILPAYFARVDVARHTPDRAIFASALVASGGILGCHLAGDFLLGIDILTTTILLNFVLVSASLFLLQGGDPARAKTLGLRTTGLRAQLLPLASGICLVLLLLFHVHRDITGVERAWYLRSTWLLGAAICLAALLYLPGWLRLRKRAHEIPPQPEKSSPGLLDN